MKDHLQTIINACFVISITAFIYQNNAQQDRIDALEAQTDISKSIKDIDALMYDLSVLEVEVETHKERFITLINNWKQQDTYNNDLKDLLDEVADSVNDNESDIQAIAQSLGEIENSMLRLSKPKSTQAIKNIIETCKTDYLYRDGVHDHKLKC